MKWFIFSVLAGAVLPAVGCTDKQPPRVLIDQPPMSLEAAVTLIDARGPWTQLPPIEVPRYPAEKFLKGWVIVLDPGHGGEDGGAVDSRLDYKRGPTGVREADMNWRVGVLLKRLLEDAGVKVIMTRDGDQTVSLARRSQIANEAHADLFVSLHHNAVDNRTTNYTSVWYHGEVDWSEPDLDVADAVSRGIGWGLRTDVARTSPIFSDQLMYRSGFGVLRGCEMPAILCESSFYTNPAEEQRLRDAGYNLREAYGIYVGLCEYAYGGRPTQSMPVATLDGSRVTISTTLNDGLPPWWGSERNRIVTSSLNVQVDGNAVPLVFDPKTRVLTASIDLSAGESKVVTIHHQNMFKHHNWPQRYAVERSGVGVAVRQIPARRARNEPTSRPASAHAS